jgi:phosphoglycerol transferase
MPIPRIPPAALSFARIAASLLYLSAIALAARVALVPSSAADKPGAVALLCLVAAGLLVWRLPVKARVPWGFYLTLALPVIALLPMVVIARAFRRLDMVSLLFHADMGVADAGVEGLETEVLQGVLVCLVLVLGLRGLVRIWGTRWRGIAAMAVALLALNPLFIALGILLTMPAPKDDLSRFLSFPGLAAAPAEPPVDLLMIYIEGTDRQFADPANWGDVYAPLQAIAKTGTAFTRVEQITGTGWSLAGVVATQCGVPILPRGVLYGTNFERLPQFMPGLTCLGDLLHERGYDARYIVGGPLDFGGLDILFRGHGYTEAIGRHELESRLPKSEVNAALIGWVLDDQLVFDQSTRLHQAMLAKDDPYALVIETIGPHGAKGWISRHCAPDGRAGFSSDFRAVLKCTIDDTAAFVAAAQARQAASRPDRPLLVVLLSDHLNHNAQVPVPGAEFGGFNTVIFTGAGLPAGKVVTKPAAMIDVAPTVMQALGLSAPPHQAGLGVSLFTEAPTLVERFGGPALEPMLLFNRDLANRIWNPPPPGPPFQRGRPPLPGPSHRPWWDVFRPPHPP